METDRWAWDRYWHSDRVASCLDDFGRSNYDASVAAGWTAFFETLPNSAHVLDLCTGNGAIAMLAVVTSQSGDGDFTVVGVDRADIDPARFAASHRDLLDQVEFRGGIEAESLPFDDGSFDAVTSQYGIEYSDLDRSLPEAVRVLRPGGQLRFAMHATEGAVVAETQAAVADADFMLDEIAFPDRVAACLGAVLAVERAQDVSSQAKAEADRCFASFNEALDQIRQRMAVAADRKMMENAVSVLLHAYRHRAHFDLPVLIDKTEEIRAEIDAHRLRQRALLAAAVSRDRMAEIETILTDIGLRGIRIDEQRSDNGLLAHVIEGERPR